MFEQISVPLIRSGTERHLLLQGDGRSLFPALQPFAGQIQCIYLDPPFMTGKKFTRRRRFGEKGWRTGRPLVQFPSYSDSFPSREVYLENLKAMLENARALLRDTGILCLHLDWHTSAYGRILCDEVFGEKQFINEIIWSYESGGMNRNGFARKHDTILLYGRTENYRFDITRAPLEKRASRDNHMKRCTDEDGRTYRTITTNGREYRYYDDEPVYPTDVWTDISHLQQRDLERTGYRTQKPEKLLERLLAVCARPGEWVCDLTAGSGTTAAAARNLGISSVSVDISAEALMLTAARLGWQDVRVMAEDEKDGALLEGDNLGNGALLSMVCLHTRHPEFPETEAALDPLEIWGAGRLSEEGLTVEQVFRRTARTPELPVLAMLPEHPGELGVFTVDAAGRLRVYRWTD